MKARASLLRSVARRMLLAAMLGQELGRRDLIPLHAGIAWVKPAKSVAMAKDVILECLTWTAERPRTSSARTDHCASGASA